MLEFVRTLPKAYRFVFEFRNTTWYTDEIYGILHQYNIGFCIYELAGHLSPVNVTADFVYLRLHGPCEKKYQGSYTKAALRKWGKKISDWQQGGKDVFVYFDNDQLGYAAINAQTLQQILSP